VFVGQALAWLSGLMRVLALVVPLLSTLDPHGGKAIAPGVAVLKMSYTLADWLSPGQDNFSQETLDQATALREAQPDRTTPMIVEHLKRAGISVNCTNQDLISHFQITSGLVGQACQKNS
jgi:hypothetical protein